MGEKVPTLRPASPYAFALHFSDFVPRISDFFYRNYLEPMCSTIVRHAASHFRHSSAHFFMCSSSLNFSHSSPHCLHASAQALQIVVEKGPMRAAIEAAAEQCVAQS